MKTYLGLLLLMLSAGFSFAGEAPYLRITRNGNGSQLQWTNCTSARAPIYEVLWANAPTGAWHRVCWLTNSTSLALPQTNQTAFYRLSWREDPTRTLDYAYYPLNSTDTNCAAVTGTLSFDPSWDQLSGTWNFAQSQCASGPPSHPLGPGSICDYNGASYRDGSSIHIVLTCGYPGTTLIGYYYEVLDSSGSRVPMMYGEVWQGGFSGMYQTGTFTARGR